MDVTHPGVGHTYLCTTDDKTARYKRRLDLSVDLRSELRLNLLGQCQWCQKLDPSNSASY